MAKQLRICAAGHRYFKSGDCPTCPVCEAAGKPAGGFLATVSAPARRALESSGITTIERLSEYSEKDVLSLHGIGPSAIPKLKAALSEQNLQFSKIKKEEMDNINNYILAQPEAVRQLLSEVREAIEKAAPDAVGGTSYGMPAYKLNGKPLVYFAAAKNHIGFYGTPVTHEAFAKELSKYKQGRGSVQFPSDKKIPLSLISKMVKFKVKNIKEAAKK